MNEEKNNDLLLKLTCTGKYVQPSTETALRVLRAMDIKGKISDDKPMAVFICEFCRKIHIAPFNILKELNSQSKVTSVYRHKKDIVFVPTFPENLENNVNVYNRVSERYQKKRLQEFMDLDTDDDLDEKQ